MSDWIWYLIGALFVITVTSVCLLFGDRVERFRG